MATDCGLLARNLYGHPGLVLGIARGGTAIATAFAASSEAESFSVITRQRPTSRGIRGRIRRQLVQLVPNFLRRLYKRLFFTLSVRLTLLLGLHDTPTLDASLATDLTKALLKRGAGTIWVIDDSIDSGGTAAAVLDAVRDQLPNTPVLLYTLTTSIGVRIAEQLNVFAERLDYIEGDISNLTAADVPGRPAARALSGKNDGAQLSAAPRTLYLDVDSVLTRNLLQSSLAALRIALSRNGSPLRAGSLAIGATLCRAGVITSQTMAHRIDAELARMNDADRSVFRDCLVTQLTHDCRWSLVSIASAHHVSGQLVTTAPEIACGALSEALGIPILQAATEEQGPVQWLDADSSAKARTVCADIEQQERAGRQTRVLALGASLQSPSVPAQNVAATDRTGLRTMLAAHSWWTDPAEDTHRSSEER